LVSQISGTLVVSGVTAPVRIVRDTWGVPHIYAASQDDLLFAQGFVQAQDRLFQMDLWRRSSQGRLSEVLGPNFIERDAMTRRIQYRGDLAKEWASYGSDARTIAGAFVRGVNAWIVLARERPPEAFVLAGWKPEPWSADELLNRTDAFTSSGDVLDEVSRASDVPELVAEMIRRVGTPPFFLGLAAPVTEGIARPAPDPPAVARSLAHPSLRYFVHLNAPGWNVIGATAPWHPGVAAGHNDRIAWSAEPIDVDTQDVYVEKLNPANPRQVDDGGRWVDIDERHGAIGVRGRKTPVDFTTDTTRHGVIVASDLGRHLAYAIRWSGSEPGAAAELAAPSLDRAATSAEFRTALMRWKMPPRLMTYADADGGHGSAIAALVPVRRAHEWVGWETADEIRTRTAYAPARPLDTPAAAVVFAHPLGVTAAARRRFNLTANSRAGAATDPLAMAFDVADWDRSTAINAPGQSESPDSPHFADLVTLWAEGQRFPLAFSERAVGANAAATLTLIPRESR
jgi:penicillin amidase